MGPRKSLNFLTLNRKNKTKVSENNFLHSVCDFRNRVTKRRSTGAIKTLNVSCIIFCCCYSTVILCRRIQNKYLFSVLAS